MASAFIRAMDSTDCRTTTENGAVSLTARGVGDARVALFSKLVRGQRESMLHDLVNACIAEARNEARDRNTNKGLLLMDDVPDPEAQCVVDLFVMAFNARDVKEGKGERALFASLIRELCTQGYTETACACLELVGHYGCFKDLVQLAASVDADLEPPAGPAASSSRSSKPPPRGRCDSKAAAQPPNAESLARLREAALAVLKAQLEADASLPADSRRLSLAAKWAPRENRAHSPLAKDLALAMFPGCRDARARYRRLVAGLNARLGTVEREMCGGAWDVDPTKVPARCMKNHRRAFLNLTSSKNNKRSCPDHDNSRRSDDPARVACAERFAAAAKRARERPPGATDKPASLHGANLQPHEIVRQIERATDQAEIDILEAQWLDLVERLRADADADGGAASSLGNMVPLVDVSGSMSGTPMEVAVALGLLVSELAAPGFRDRFLTFESQPRWVQLEAGAPLRERVTAAKSAPWGGSTNLQAALELILRQCTEAQLHPDDVAGLTLVVFSDMQFDQAGNGTTCWETQYEALARAFASAGERTRHRAPYPVPAVVFWNLRAGPRDYPADATTPGVTMLSGFSGALLKQFLKGEVDPESCTAAAFLRASLDHPRYDRVREACARSGEGCLAGYTSEARAGVAPPAGDEAAAADESEEAQRVPPEGEAAAEARARHRIGSLVKLPNK